MNKKEAIQAMLDGKKVAHDTYDKLEYYMCFNGEEFVSGDGVEVSVLGWFVDGWNIYEEPKARGDAPELPLIPEADMDSNEHKRIKHAMWCEKKIKELEGKIK